jgi:hypothetical protein
MKAILALICGSLIGRAPTLALVRRIASVLIVFGLCNVPVYANWCGTPGKDGSATISGIVNTYYPGTANEATGSTSINVGTARGSAAAIATGDLLLIVQMQDASIDTTNDSGYGDNVSGGFANGYTAINQSGRYEFVRATGPVSGGAVPIVGATGGGTVNAYNFAALSSASRRQSFQVIRVPQYLDATISGTLTASAWDGSSGGVVAIDVSGRLTFSGGAISVAGLGFRGGGARQLAGGAGTDTDYLTLASVANNGAKGEGVAGTPRYVNNGGTLQDNVVEGYVNGSNARGAPGNAGGGGTDGNPAANDQNTGGGGGGNGGAGGKGGDAWCPGGPPTCDTGGGHPGANVSQAAYNRLVMGGGGGAATTNNGTGSPGSGFASSGAAGGGAVFVRAGEFAGTGTINADGASANSTVLNDGTGGGGAGGSVLVTSIRSVAGASLSISADGGDGGTNTGGGSAHGPGGGGGGGVIMSTSTISVSASVAGGSAGTTQGGGSLGANYGATAGSSGVTSASVTAANVPGQSSGGECTPTIAKSFATSPITPGTTSRMSIAVTNNNPTLAMTSLAFTDSYPSGLINTASPATAKSCATAGTLTAPASGTSFVLSGGTINAATSCTYSVNTTANTNGNKTNTIGVGGFTWSTSSGAQASLTAVSAVLSVSPPLTVVKSSVAYSDPQNGTVNAKYIPGGYVGYNVTVANPGSYAVDNNSVIIVDATPANLQLFVGNIPGGVGPVLFTNGVPASGLTYTFTSLASTTDDVEFSNNGGSTWTYVPVANANQVDPNVTHMRIRPKGIMAAGTSFTLGFGYMIQ